MKPSSLVNVPAIINRSGYDVTAHCDCPSIKRHHWFAIDKAMTGDAPKDFIAVYEHGDMGCRKSSTRSWPRYIAKVGHKWYPNESIAEHLVSRLGSALGLEMAKSRLVHLRGQVRYLSRYFLSDSEYLLHGADIFASYLGDHDREFVLAVENENKSPEYFDYHFITQAIQAMFPTANQTVLVGFRRMLAFDAIIGNNDRHFFNWAAICDPIAAQPPRFSPIFDTARALFWNHSEQRLSRLEVGKNNARLQLRKYCQQSYSKVGARGFGKVNHFALLRSILEKEPETLSDLDILATIEVEPVELVRQLLSEEFSRLISPLRQLWICRLLEYRTEQFRRILSGEACDV